jgi:hypothetical protein
VADPRETMDDPQVAPSEVLGLEWLAEGDWWSEDDPDYASWCWIRAARIFRGESQ